MNLFSRAYIDSLYEDYQNDPDSLSPDWQKFFRDFDPSAEFNSVALPVSQPVSRDDHSVAQLQDRVDQLVRGFRVRGHLEANIDPLCQGRQTNQELNPENYGLSPADLEKTFSARTVDGKNFKRLEDLLHQLRNTYCRSIGVQFMHIDDHFVRNWIQTRVEGSQNRMELDRKTQLRILTRLTDAVVFEEFTRRKYIGAKTFSLEGAETLIPLLDRALEKAGEHGIKEVVIGMAHRGRLNVLANIMGKRAQNIFWGFDDPDPEAHRGAGDVLYHLGHSSDWTTAAGKKIHISLCFNPSHLEYVNPVAQGRCRSKQDRAGDETRDQGLTILIHGDAAFAGEGVVQETLNLSRLRGYEVGGTLHVIVNNQVGFTTNTHEGRSTTYASDVAKMLQIPIFHVNGEDPEAVAQVVELSMEFRSTFKRDVVIDMYCYRRLGHNESDEPRFTQPAMYQRIDAKRTIRDSYLKRLLKMQEITREEADAISEARANKLQSEFDNAKMITNYAPDTQSGQGLWSGHYGGFEREDDVDTGVAAGKLSYVVRKLAEMPDGFELNRKLKRVLGARAEMADGERPVDWPTAELAAFGSLAIEGHRVRLSGQDCRRGTFSQRHAVLFDSNTGEVYDPLKHLDDNQAEVDIINSPLSESGVLGFDYGYSLDAPDALVCWEAQFGDFYNAAQVIVDQFICSAEDKWRRLSGITMLLPHGFEGAGPEHCSARMERFLTLTAEHNMQCAVPTTAANYFHLLRRQVKRPWRKPLIVFTPKALLREPTVMSPLSDFFSGIFERVIPDDNETAKQNPSKVVLTAGKIGVDLRKLRTEYGRDDVSIIRVEQLYPFPKNIVEQLLEGYPEGVPVYWAQEEPRNMGAWYFIKIKWDESGMSRRWPLKVISRPESASPSTGSRKAHKIEESELFDEVFGDAPTGTNNKRKKVVSG